jgi:F-type H+-transporting ATPase subunit epsilon
MPFHLTIVTPQGSAYEGSVEGIVLPGTEGDFGVLAGHERLLAPLRVGAVEIRENAGSTYAAIADGFAEVDGEHVVVLVESCEVAHEIDVATEHLAIERAEEGLRDLAADENSMRREEYEASLERARNRIAVAERK